jgi:hypothetical protein
MRARIRTFIPTQIEVAVYGELASLRSSLSREEVRTPSGSSGEDVLSSAQGTSKHQVRLSDHLP